MLDIGSGEFRDPKVFWYEPDQRWIMVVALAVERNVSIYASKTLKNAQYFIGDFDGRTFRAENIPGPYTHRKQRS